MLASNNGCIAEYRCLGLPEKPISDSVQFFVRIIMNDYRAALLRLSKVDFGAQSALEALSQVSHVRIDHFGP